MAWETEGGQLKFSTEFQKEGVRLFELDPTLLTALKAGDRCVLRQLPVTTPADAVPAAQSMLQGSTTARCGYVHKECDVHHRPRGNVQHVLACGCVVLDGCC